MLLNVPKIKSSLLHIFYIYICFEQYKDFKKSNTYVVANIIGSSVHLK